MFAIGVWIYMRTTTARDAAGRWALGALSAFLAIGFLDAQRHAAAVGDGALDHCARRSER